MTYKGIIVKCLFLKWAVTKYPSLTIEIFYCVLWPKNSTKLYSQSNDTEPLFIKHTFPFLIFHFPRRTMGYDELFLCICRILRNVFMQKFLIPREPLQLMFKLLEHSEFDFDSWYPKGATCSFLPQRHHGLAAIPKTLLIKMC